MIAENSKKVVVLGAIVAFTLLVIIVALIVERSLRAKPNYRLIVIEWIEDNYGYTGIKVLEWEESVTGPGTSSAKLMVEGRHEIRVLIEQDDKTVAKAGERGLGLVEFHLVIHDGKVERRR